MSFADGKGNRSKRNRPTRRTDRREGGPGSIIDPYERDFQQQKAEELKEDVDSGLDNILRTTDEIKQRGAQTNMKLAVQGSQMRRALEELDDVHENMDQAEYHMARMEMCCCVQLCCCCCSCCKPEKTTTERRFKKGARGFHEPLMSKVPKSGVLTSEPKPDRIDDRYDNGEGISSEEAFEDRYNAKLDGVLNAVKDIKELSEDMHEEIEYQNKELIPALNDRVDETGHRVKVGERRARRL
eukprot:jgi/Bigna1/87203/estExt_fgenesh1_pg.C_170195